MLLTPFSNGLDCALLELGEIVQEIAPGDVSSRRCPGSSGWIGANDHALGQARRV